MSPHPAMLVAAGIHAVMAAPIFWVKEEPYKLQVLLASTLRGVLAVEGFQDEWELITEAQYHLVKDRLFIKFNNAFGLTPKAPNWAPEYGVLTAF